MYKTTYYISTYSEGMYLVAYRLISMYLLSSKVHSDLNPLEELFLISLLKILSLFVNSIKVLSIYQSPCY